MEISMKVKVSVLMLTYNHENFIAQAIDSVLMQQVNFPYELVIGEDCSTDNTRNIVISYQKRYPEKIRLLLPEKNLGPQRNFVEVFKACQGEYIALLEGDDYCTSPHKLQKQVDFLDSNPECAISYHLVEIFDQEKGCKTSTVGEDCNKQISTLEDFLLFKFPMQTSSVMFRKKLLVEIPEGFYEMKMGDVIVFAIVAQHGNFEFMNEKMTVWRWHSGGGWTPKPRLEQMQTFITIWELLKTCLKPQYKNTLDFAISKFYLDLADQYDGIGKLHEVRSCTVKSFLKCPWKEKIHILIRIHNRSPKRLLMLYFPSMFNYLRNIKFLVKPIIMNKFNN